MILYKNCKIVTMDEKNMHADYLVVDGGKIMEVGVGSPAETAGARAFSNVIDLQGSTVVPGFWESHLHIIEGTRSITELNLRSCSDYDNLVKKVDEYKTSLADGDWIIGHGWDEKKVFGGVFPDRQLLDRLCKNHPMLLIRMDGHSLCINTKALEVLGTNWVHESPEIPLGEDGLPVGMIYEDTAYLLDSMVSDNLSEGYIERIILKAQGLFFENGICSVNDIITRRPQYFDIYKRLYEEGKLKLRITSAASATDAAMIEAFEQRRQYETDKLKVGPPKCFIDGSFGSRTALLFDEYADEKGNYGLKIINDSELVDIIASNVRANRSTAIHAIGDKAVSDILDAYENTGMDFHEKGIRGRIEHIQIIRENDIERFSRNNITASFQPVFLYEKELTLSRLGQERLGRVYRFKSFLKKGINVLLNSDWPYGGGDFPKKPDGNGYIAFEPILGIHAACCQQFNENEALTPMEALKCYTVNAAYANHREMELGMLKEGYFADFTVLSKDISKCEPQDTINCEVLMTIINGEIVYNKI